MKKLTARHAPGWMSGSVMVATHLVSWHVALGAMLIGGLLRICSEWARRMTLIAIVTKAPAHTVVIQDSGWGGPAMLIIVGEGAKPVQLPRSGTD